MSPAARLELTREQILGFRRATSHLDKRLPPGPKSIREAARTGLSDSMPRAALLSLHARVKGVGPTAWDEPPLAQTWALRYSAYVVAEEDIPVFTLGRLKTDEKNITRAVDTADRLESFLDGRKMSASEAGHAMGVHPNSLRYGSPTGRIRIRWDGARQPTIWMQPPPAMTIDEARLELARRYFHVFGPGTARGFGEWAGLKPPRATATVEELGAELLQVSTPVGEGWILARDEAAARAPRSGPEGPRLLPSGDTFFLLWGADRELLVSDKAQRASLWTSRVWPGCLLVDGEPAGVWRRANAVVGIEPWRKLTTAERHAVEAEAATFPLPGLEGRVSVRWIA